MTDRRKLIVHGREYQVTKKQLALDLGVSGKELEEIWKDMKKRR